MPNGSPGFFFLRKTFRMNEQPVSQIPFKGDWGRLPQQANLWRLHRRENRENEWTCTGLHCLPICEAVQLCTACHFMQAENDGQIIFKWGIVSLSHLWSIRPQVKICFLVFWTCEQLGNKLFLFPTSWRRFYFPTIRRKVVSTSVQFEPKLWSKKKKNTN